MIKIKNYHTVKKLGKGGMATVYLAQHELLDRNVALKVLVFGASDPAFRDNFIKEGRIVATLKHPNIVDIYDIGIEDDSFYMVMEFIEKGTLKQQLQQRTLNITEILRIIGQIASALSYAHKRRYIHRDVKPENILFRSDDTCVLADFGIAKLQGTKSDLTQMGYKSGTPCYMSPEQAMGEAMDTRTDIYSLGVVLYEMLTGKKLFNGENTVAIAYKHAHEKVPALPPAYRYLQPALNKALEKRKEDRYVDVIDFFNELRYVYENKDNNIYFNSYADEPIHENSQAEEKRFLFFNKKKENKPKVTSKPQSQSIEKNTATIPIDAINVIKHKRRIQYQSPWFGATIASSLFLIFGSVGAYYFMNGSQQNEVKPLVSTRSISGISLKNEIADKQEQEEAKRIAAEKAKAERIATEKAEAERIAAEKAEAKRIAIATEKAEAERIAAEKVEVERIAAEKAKAERIAAEKAEAKRIAAEKVSKDKKNKKLAVEKSENRKNKKKERNRRTTAKKEQSKKEVKKVSSKKEKSQNKKNRNKNKQPNVIDQFIQNEAIIRQNNQKKWQQEKRVREQRQRAAAARKRAEANRKAQQAREKAKAQQQDVNDFMINDDEW